MPNSVPAPESPLTASSTAEHGARQPHPKSQHQKGLKTNGKAHVKGVKTSGAAAVVPPLPLAVSSIVTQMEQAAERHEIDGARKLLFEALSQVSDSSKLSQRIAVLTRFIISLEKSHAALPQGTLEVLADTAWAGFGALDAPATTASANLVDALVRWGDRSVTNAPLKLLLSHAQAHMLRKQALFVFEALWSSTGSLDVFFDQELFGPSPVESLYAGLLSVPRGVETNYRRRSRVAVALLTEDARRNGVEFKKGLIVSAKPHTADVWRRWASSWAFPLAHTLIHTTMRQRAVIAAHHLPDLFGLSHHALPHLLHVLCTLSTSISSDALRAPAVLTVLRVGKEMGLVVTGSDAEAPVGSPADTSFPVCVTVPTSLLNLWAEAANAEVQVSTFGLLISSKTLATPLLKRERDMITSYLNSTFVFVSPESRTAVRGYFIHLLDRLRASSHAASKVLSRRSSSSEQIQQASQNVDEAHSFLESLVHLVRSHLHTGSTYVASTQALSMLRSILADGVDANFSVEQTVAKRNDQYPRTVSVADDDMVRRLLSMIYSTYDTTIAASVQLLECFPRPLPGLESPENVLAMLIKPAQALLLSAREHEAATASALLQLYQTVYAPLGYPVLQLAPSSTPTNESIYSDLQPIHALLDFLELHLVAAAPVPEGKGLVTAALNDPLHGALISLQRMYHRLHGPGEDKEFNRQLQSTNARVLKDIEGVWVVVSPILCSAAPEGNSGEVDEREAALNVEEEAPSDTLQDEEDEGTGTYTTALKGQGHRAQAVLHYSWRGIKEASTLLASVVSSTLRATPEHSVWTTEDLRSVGQTFQHWLLNVRHRGAFSTIYPALARVATAVLLHAPLHEQRSLPHMWLTRFLDTIAAPDAKALTITRRSAGLGYSVVALLNAAVSARDMSLVRATVSRLGQIARQDGANELSERKTPSIHAFNTLRYMIADKNLSSALRPELGPLIPLSVDRFRSALWSVRNAALMLYASLLTRIFTLQLANAHASALSLTLPDLLGQFPGLDEFIRSELAQALEPTRQASTPLSEDVRTTPLFAVLLLLARLRPPSDTHSVGETIIQLVIPQLASPLWQVREQAAWAIVALTPPSHAGDRAVSLVSRASLNSNERHGAWFTAWIVTRSVGVSSSLAELAAKAKSNQALHPVVRHVAHQVILSASSRAFSSAREDDAESDENAKLKSVPEPETRLENVDEESAARVLGPLLHSVYLKTQNSSAFFVSAEDQTGPWSILIQRADETPCIPEKEQILLVLGRRMHMEGMSVGPAVQKAVLQRIYAGSAEEEPDSTRTVALAALAQIPPSMYFDESHVLGLAALLNLLADDELEIRLAAARLGAQLLVHLASELRASSSRWSSTTPWATLAREGPLLGFTADRGIALIYDHMASLSGPTAHAWGTYLVQQVMCDEDEWDIQTYRAFPSHTPLFAPERPNLHVDRIAAIRINLEAALRTALPCLNQTDKASVTSRAAALIHRIHAVVPRLIAAPSATATVEAERSLLITLLLAAAELVVATARSFPGLGEVPRSVDDLAIAANELQSKVSVPLDTLYMSERLAQIESQSQERRVSSNDAPNTSSSATSKMAPQMAQAPSAHLDSDPPPARSHSILMVSDFFFPNVGGVEGHIYMVAQGLVARGHKVVILTHAYDDRIGIRWLSRGIKVYYVPYAVVARQDSLPNFFCLVPLFRSIVIRERVSIVHAHQALSSMGLESLLHAACMGLHTVFTDHSLFGMDNAASILTSKLLRFLLAGVGHIIAVSHVGKENTALRARLDPQKVSVIPNAVVASQFAEAAQIRGRARARAQSRTLAQKESRIPAELQMVSLAHNPTQNLIHPEAPLRAHAHPHQAVCTALLNARRVCTTVGRRHATSTSVLATPTEPTEPELVSEQDSGSKAKSKVGSVSEPQETITIVVLSRLMYRKGTDLLEAAIPRICCADKHVHFLIGGDGPNRVSLEQMREREELQARVRLVGSVPNTQVAAHLAKGDILLNTSLTEAFGTGLVEGAAAGLLVVSTCVGGVSEVLPDDMIFLAETDEDDLVSTVLSAVQRIREGVHDPVSAHERVVGMYSWAQVAARTENVYDRLCAEEQHAHGRGAEGQERVQGQGQQTGEWNDFASSGLPRISSLSQAELLVRYHAAGHPFLGGVVFVIVAAVDMILLALLEWVQPASEMDQALDFWH